VTAKAARIDFAQLLRDLISIGISPVAVADELSKRLGESVARSTPYRWLEGSTPLYQHGAALLLLHSEKFRHSESEKTNTRAREGEPDQGT
jgi:hypothetical protein